LGFLLAEGRRRFFLLNSGFSLLILKLMLSFSLALHVGLQKDRPSTVIHRSVKLASD